MFVIDTNLVSEIFRPVPDAGVVQWFALTERDKLFLPSVVIGELYLGVDLLPAGKRRDSLAGLIGEFIDDGGDDNILPFGAHEAMHYARIAGRRKSIGRPIHVIDAQIAATAASTGFAVVTRNVRDFEECGIAIVNPWEHGRV
jgi:toxin FitB